MLGVLALAFAGVFAGMLANTKSVYFYKALVAHVDLSVMVWFLAMSFALIQFALPGQQWQALGSGALISMTIAAIFIGAAVFTPGIPYQNNYVPVIYHPLFFLGLGLLFCSVLCVVAQFLLTPGSLLLVMPVRAGIMAMAEILLIAMFCFLYVYYHMPAGLHGQEYYDTLFWAGGHVLQIAYTQVMLVAWLWLAEVALIKLPLKRRWVLICYGFGVLEALLAVFYCLKYMPGTADYHDAFTALMRDANGLPALVIGGALVLALFKDRKGFSLPVICLIMSLLLFAAGGGLGYAIHGSNVTVPAHYHGSIVGVTLALMGLAYVLMPKLGLGNVSGSLLARLQPVLYGGGQLCWMMGMAIGGAQGIGRKIPGSADVIGGLGGFLKHAGDGLSLIGGLLFVFVMVKAVIHEQRERKAT